MAVDTVVISADKPVYQGHTKLAPNSAYAIVPDPNSRWEFASGASYDFHGSGPYDSAKTPILVGNVRLGGLVLTVWYNNDANPNSPQTAEVISFEPGTNYAYIRTGRHGATATFVMADEKTSYGDNRGVCKVAIAKDDGSGSAIKPILPITVTKGSARWRIDPNGSVHGAIDYTVGSGTGSKKYGSAIIVEFADSTTYEQLVTKTVGRPLFGTRKGTEDFDLPSIPASKVNLIRNAYATFDQDDGVNTLGKYVEVIVEAIKDADKAYRSIKSSELIKDGVKVFVAGS